MRAADPHRRIAVIGERSEVRGYTVAVANSKAYGGGMYLVPHADLEDGELDVLAISEHGKLAWLRDVPKVFKGTHVELPMVHGYGQVLVKAVQSGKVSEAQLNESVRRVLADKVALGLFE